MKIAVVNAAIPSGFLLAFELADARDMRIEQIETARGEKCVLESFIEADSSERDAPSVCSISWRRMVLGTIG